MLGEHGYTWIEASDGEVVLEILPPAVILHVVMRGMSRSDLTLWLMDLNPV